MITFFFVVSAVANVLMMIELHIIRKQLTALTKPNKPLVRKLLNG